MEKHVAVGASDKFELYLLNGGLMQSGQVIGRVSIHLDLAFIYKGERHLEWGIISELDRGEVE